MDPVKSSALSSSPTSEPFNKNKNSPDNSVSIISSAMFILLALGVIAFLYNQNQSLKKQIYNPMATSTPITNTPSPTPIAQQPLIYSPLENDTIKSPLKVTGVVPTGWMSEGVFPIKILDSNQKILASGQAKEVVPGSWQSGNAIEFTATLTFKGASGSGTLVLENDNPSGNPENAKTYEIPVTF